MKYPILKKYLCSCTNNKEFFIERKNRFSSNILCGWITPTDEWIKVETFHTHPNYLKALEPTKFLHDEHESLDAEIIGAFKAKGNIYNKNETYYDNLLKFSHYCIQQGSIRVTEKNNTIYLNAGSFNRLKKGLKIIERLMYSKNTINSSDVVGETIDLDGKVTGIWNVENFRLKRQINI